MTANTTDQHVIDLDYLRGLNSSALREMLAFLDAEAAIIRGILERRAADLDSQA